MNYININYALQQAVTFTGVDLADSETFSTFSFGLAGDDAAGVLLPSVSNCRPLCVNFMTNERTIKDSKDIKSEFESLKARETVLHERFLALGMDYNFYMAVKTNEDKLFKIRNDIFYRIYGTNFHIQLLLNEFIKIQYDLESLFKKRKEEKNDSPFLQSPEMYALTYHATQKASVLFDSIIYHISSIFDYLGNLTNYIFNLTKSREQAFKWNSVSSASRDNSHILYKLKVGEVIRKIDNEFTGKLYDHRSTLIHKESDVCKISVLLSNSEPPMLIRFMSSEKFSKKFSSLRDLNDNYDLTMSFIVFWLMNQTYDSIKEILFAMREDILIIGTHPFIRKGAENALIFGMKGKNNEMVSTSESYWNFDNKL